MTENRQINLTRRSLLIASCMCIGCAVPGPLFAAAPIATSEAPGFYRLMVGDYEVMALSDGKLPLAAMKLLQGNSARIAEALKSDFLGEQVETSHNSFLVNTGDKLVLVDAGAGTLLGPHTGKLLGNLRSAGYRPEQVDEVYLTHMHTDHIGGLMSGEERAFPNAIIRADKRDADYWLSEEEMRAAPAEAKRFFQATMASLSPYMKAGKLKTFEGSTDLIPGIRAQPAYGHTPGHTMFEIESKGEKLLLWGDIVHVATVQFADPTVTIGYDVDRTQAEQEHWRVFDDAARSRCMIGGAHLPFPGLGHVRDNGDKTYAYVPLS
ncbi:MBL fold metallo-hydrolase [Rhizobium sp. LEGMi198b]|uniref:MBL fold metallo-hydrolase n=1 Tax=unclassified Rhizobium TaxID=2613769 RepID=UPI000CDF3364|nr:MULTISPECIES: MBL fold metallo-hydrolase [Rhizobium]AVA26243.1 metallo-beta-lactamase family hydrolase protein [Rhizobium sp. NXC24]UWU23912.1 MBL fold metallo-hydrolase [Rhizobium tropici]